MGLRGQRTMITAGVSLASISSTVMAAVLVSCPVASSVNLADWVSISSPSGSKH